MPLLKTTTRVPICRPQNSMTLDIAIIDIIAFNDDVISAVTVLGGAQMASITIRNLDEELKHRLRVRSAHHDRSMEDEVREILRTALSEQAPTAMNLAAAIHRRFAKFDLVEFSVPAREPVREPPQIDE